MVLFTTYTQAVHALAVCLAWAKCGLWIKSICIPYESGLNGPGGLGPAGPNPPCVTTDKSSFLVRKRGLFGTLAV